jgi:hypothetical protein
MARFQRGSLRVESRKNGQNWVLRYYVTRTSDGRRVEHKIPIGLVHDFPTESAAWAEVERQHLQLNAPRFQNSDHVLSPSPALYESRTGRTNRNRRQNPTPRLQATSGFSRTAASTGGASGRHSVLSRLKSNNG